MTHVLKTWPAPFAAVLDGTKHHEIRKADRPFAVGDVLELREWNPEKRMETYGDGFCVLSRGMDAWRYTGRSLAVRVTYLSAGGTWGLPTDLCVMSIERIGGEGRR